MKFILGLKLGMSQIFNEKGEIIPVTLVEAGPCVVTQVKKSDGKDKYGALQLGFVKKVKNVKSAEKGKEFKYLKEQRAKDEDLQMKAGDIVDVSAFAEGEKVKVTGISKGKGFQGAVKKWGFKGKLSKTHGTKHETRTLGSTGVAGHARVMKGRKMPGRMGTQKTTVRNLKIVKLDKENNLLAFEGALPGRNGALLEISSL